MTDHYDLIIVGGGMVGASLVRALSRLGLQIAVVEMTPPSAPRQPSYDDRAIALSHGSCRIFQSIGVWERLRQGAEPIRHIHVSDRGRFGFARLDAAQQGVDALGYVVTGQWLGQVLFQGLEQLPGVTLYCPARLTGVRVEAGGVAVDLEQQQELTLRGRLLVAADGAHSPVRRQLGIATREWGYGQCAVISNLTPERPRAATAFERFTDQGPMAMLPLPGGRYGMVWTVPEEQLDAVLGLDDEAFLDSVQQRFGDRLGRFLRCGRRASYPLKLMQAREPVRERVAIIGNAAHSVHPITGQGFNLGLRDVAALAEVVAGAHRAGQDVGALDSLRHYVRWRGSDQQRVAMLTDGLVRLFCNPLPPVRMLRDLGMLALDLAPPLKRLLGRQFMGLQGPLPRLARGLPLE